MINKLNSSIWKDSSRSMVVKKNILGSLLVKGISIIVQLALVPLTIGYVSKEIYGIWLTLSSVVLWLNFFDVGFTLGLRNRLGEAIANHDWEKGKKLVSTTYFMMFIIFVPITIVVCSIIPFVDWTQILNVKSDYNDSIVTAMLVLMICFGFQMITNIITSVISAYQKTALASAFPVIGNVLSLITIYILTLSVEPSLGILALSISIYPILVLTLFTIIMFNGELSQVKPSIKYIDRHCIGDLFGLGIKFFIIQLQMVVMQQSANFLISSISGPEDVTNYNIAYKYISVAMMTFYVILTPLWPAFTNAYARKDYKWMNKIYRKLTIIYFFVFISILIMTCFSPIVYKIWIGDNIQVPLEMTIAVACYMLLTSWDSLQVSLINGIGKVKLESYVTLIGLFFNIPLSFLLGKYFGAIGVIYSMSLIIIIYICFFTTQIRKILSEKAFGIWNQ